jgi:hypothetical protein
LQQIEIQELDWTMNLVVTSRAANTYVLVLTASVTPFDARHTPGAPVVGAIVTRNDPKVRRQDYMEAFRFWLEFDDPRVDRILFLENSGEDLTPFKQIVEHGNRLNKEVELISLAPCAIPEGFHYGWGELKMLDEGLEQSRLIQGASHFIKATGRLTFPNFRALLDRTPADCEAMVECRIPTRSYRKGLTFFSALLTREGAYASTQLAIFSRSFYQQHLFGLYKTLQPDGHYPRLIENLIYDRLMTIGKSSNVHLRFPVNCDPHGFSARRNVSYDGVSKRITSSIRGALRGTGIWF